MSLKQTTKQIQNTLRETTDTCANSDVIPIIDRDGSDKSENAPDRFANITTGQAPLEFAPVSQLSSSTFDDDGETCATNSTNAGCSKLAKKETLVDMQKKN